jgi:hypothetical protein
MEHNDIQENDIQENDIQENDIQENDIQENDIQENDIQVIKPINNPDGFRNVCVLYDNKKFLQEPCLNCYIYSSPCDNCVFDVDVIGYTNISYHDMFYLYTSNSNQYNTYEEFYNNIDYNNEYKWDKSFETRLPLIFLNK